MLPRQHQADVAAAMGQKLQVLDREAGREVRINPKADPI